MKKILLVILFAFSSYCLANNDCEIKPVLKVYQATKIDNSIHSFITKTNKEAIFIDVPKPKMIRTMSSSMYIYNKKPLKSVLFFIDNTKTEGYEAKELYLKVFGAIASDKKEIPVLSYRYDWIDCNNLPIEIKLDSKEYRVFFLTGKESDNLFIIPKSDKDNKVYIVQFVRFALDELNSILGTLKIEKE